MDQGASPSITGQATAATSTVDQSHHVQRAPRRVLPIELDDKPENDPNLLSWTLHVLAGIHSGPAREQLLDLADALADVDRIDELRSEVEAARRAADVRRMRRAWSEVADEVVREHRVGAGWTLTRFENEWRRHTGTLPDAPSWHRTPAHLPWNWRHTAGALHATGIPWHVVQAEVRFVLRDGGGPGSFALVMRRCRATLRRIRAQVEQRASDDG